jgi:hypothetical protein
MRKRTRLGLELGLGFPATPEVSVLRAHMLTTTAHTSTIAPSGSTKIVKTLRLTRDVG